MTSKVSLTFLSARFVADAKAVSLEENLELADSFATASVPVVVDSVRLVTCSTAPEVARNLRKLLSDLLPNGDVLNTESMARASHMGVLIALIDYFNDPLLWTGFVGGASSKSFADI